MRSVHHNAGRSIFKSAEFYEAVHRQFRKLTKTKGAFPNENSLTKLCMWTYWTLQRSGQCQSIAGFLHCFN